MIERLNEVKVLYEQLFSIGFAPDHESIATFRSIANRFVKTGEGSSGSLPITGFKRILVYKLSNQQHIVSTITLKYSQHT